MPLAATTLDLTIANDLSEIGRLAEEVEGFCDRLGMDAGVAHAINLSVDELLTNTISYGYDGDGPHSIDVRLAAADGAVTVTLSDDGRAFDPTEAEEPDIDAELDDRPIGGLGIHIVRMLMDNVSYERVDGRNVLTLIKNTGV